MNLYTTSLFLILLILSLSQSANAGNLKHETGVVCFDVNGLPQGAIKVENNNSSIIFKLEEDAYVVLKLFDPLGNLLAELVNSPLQAGTHNISFASQKLKPGIYFYNLLIEGNGETRKLTIK